MAERIMAGTSDAAEITRLVVRLTAARGHAERVPVRRALQEAAAHGSGSLADHLDHEDCFTRWEVVNLLGELRDPEVTTRVVDFALTEDEVHARWRSFWAVSRFQRNRTVPLLIAALDAGSEPAAWRATLMLSLMGRMEAVPRVLAALHADDVWIQWEALSALRSLRPAGTARAVIPFLDVARSTSLRQEAALALGAIGGDESRLALERALDDRHHGVRWRASMGLARIGDARSAPALRGRLVVEGHRPTTDQIRSDLNRLEGHHAAP